MDPVAGQQPIGVVGKIVPPALIGFNYSISRRGGGVG